MNKSSQLKLLPNKAKFFGLGLIALCVITLFFHSYLNWTFMSEIVKFAILIGLLIISLSKDKIEDEMKNFLRLNSYVFSLLACVIFFIIFEILNFMKMGIEMEISATHILMQIFLTYILHYEVVKQKGNDKYN